MSRELKTLGLQGFKQRELHTVIWALREFADAAGIEIHNGIKERYDAERKTYGISFRFYKESGDTMSAEREFLKKLRYASLLENDLRKELDELLAQPKQVPKFNFDLERMKAAIESPISDVTVDDLVKQVKQEPLSDKEITKNTPKLIHIGERLAFHAGVRFAEKHHGIGGGE